MKKILLVSLLIFLNFNLDFAQTGAARQTAPKASAIATKTVLPQSIEVPFVNKTLSNGLEIIVLADKSVPLATVELAVRNGSFTEPPELNGLSHLYEHMFFKPSQAVLLYRCELALKYGNVTYYNGEKCLEKAKFKNQIGSVAYLDDEEQLNIYNGTTRGKLPANFYNTRENIQFRSNSTKNLECARNR